MSNSKLQGRPVRHSNRHRAATRNGLMVVVTLVCLLVVTSIVGSMIKNAIFTRRELLAERDLRQTELMLQSGASRAAARLVTTPDFAGDSWEIPAATAANTGKGRVVTEITRTASGMALDIRVVAEYPLDRDFPIRRSQTFHVAASEAK